MSSAHISTAGKRGGGIVVTAMFLHTGGVCSQPLLAETHTVPPVSMKRTATVFPSGPNTSGGSCPLIRTPGGAVQV